MSSNFSDTTLANVIAVAGGYEYSLAVKSDGTVWGWGWNSESELGDGTTISRHTPVQTKNLTNINRIAAGYFHSLAVQNAPMVVELLRPDAQTDVRIQVRGDKILLSPSKPLTNVKLSVYNIAGELTETVYEGSVERKEYIFRPQLQAKGIYLVVLKHSGKAETTKLIKW